MQQDKECIIPEEAEWVGGEKPEPSELTHLEQIQAFTLRPQANYSSVMNFSTIWQAL